MTTADLRARLERLAGERAATLLTQMIKYAGASAAALVVDYALMVALTEFAGLHYLTSAFCGFCAGIAVAYGLSIRFVFTERRVGNPALEFAAFLAIGLVALGFNQVLMFGFVDGFGLDYKAAKIPTTGLVFCLNFGLRKALLFSAERRRTAITA